MFQHVLLFVICWDWHLDSQRRHQLLQPTSLLLKTPQCCHPAPVPLLHRSIYFTTTHPHPTAEHGCQETPEILSSDLVTSRPVRLNPGKVPGVALTRPFPRSSHGNANLLTTVNYYIQGGTGVYLWDLVYTSEIIVKTLAQSNPLRWADYLLLNRSWSLLSSRPPGKNGN